jgi:hypothetical protein
MDVKLRKDGSSGCAPVCIFRSSAPVRNASLRRSRGRLRFGIKRHEGTPCQREQIRAQNRKDDNLDKLSHDQPGHTKPIRQWPAA